MSSQTIIIIVVILVIGVLLLRTISKIFFKVLFIILLLGFLGYFLLFFHGGLLDLGNKQFILYELQDRYCKGDANDKTKCDCIITPLIKKLKEKYSDVEIQKLQKNKARSITEIIKLANENKVEIKSCLKEKKSESLWDDFIKDLKKVDVRGNIKQIFQKQDSIRVIK